MNSGSTKSKRSGRRNRESLSIGDAYAALGLNPLADRELVHAAYRRLALKYHPDKDGGNQARFKELAVAYRTLENKFRLDDAGPDEMRGECDCCGNYDLLRKSPDGSHCCAVCLTVAGRRPLLPASPIVIVSCATTIVLLTLALAALVVGYSSQAPGYSAISFVLGIGSVVSLAITCLTVIYTAEPRQLRRRQPHRAHSRSGT